MREARELLNRVEQYVWSSFPYPENVAPMIVIREAKAKLATVTNINARRQAWFAAMHQSF
jgi:hypothetical protein